MHRRRPVLATLCGASLLLTACSSGAADPPGTARASTPTSDATSSGAASSGAASSGAASTPSGPITIALAGDVHFTGRTQQYLTEPGTSRLVSALKPLADADLAVVNLETAITERGRAEPKTFTFRAPASSLDVLAAAGVDVASMANNHGVDYGPVGLEDSLAAKQRSPVAVVGIGADEDEALSPAISTVKGRKVAVIAATQVVEHTQQAFSAAPGKPGVASAAHEERLVRAVTEARARADVVVVYLHWGVERASCPSSAQKSLSRKLTEAGADVVAGGHAHQLQGAGWTSDGSAYVDYGLGNFVWWRSVGEAGVVTGVLTLTVDGRRTTKAQWTPMRIADDGLPALQTGQAAVEGQRAFEKVVGCSGLSASPPSASEEPPSPAGTSAAPSRSGTDG